MNLFLTGEWLASGPASQACDLCSHPEPCTQESPMLGLMSVVSILKFLIFFFELVFCKWSLMRQWSMRRSGRDTHIVPFCPDSPDTFHLNQNLFWMQNEGDVILRNVNDRRTLSYAFLCSFPILANHSHWKWWHPWKRKDKATHNAFSSKPFSEQKVECVGRVCTYQEVK